MSDAGHGTNVPDTLPHVETLRLGAVPAVWGDDHDGVLEATLTFRVGEADERLRTRGRCHLLRALVIDDLDTSDPDITVSASVTTLRTRFMVTGDDQAVADTLTSIARRIATLRTDRVDDVIPDVFENWKPPENWDTRLMSLRFGSRGYGLAALPLLGLTDLDAAAFSDWVRTWFNTSNAVVHANRPPTKEPDLSALPDGIRKPLPLPHPVEHALPALATGPGDRLACSLLTRFDATTALLLDLVLDRLHARCTEIDPSIPRPRSVTRRTGAYLATVGVSMTAPDATIGEIRDAVSSELFSLAMSGPTSDELDRAKVALRRSRHGRTTTAGAAAKQTATDLIYDEDRDTAAALRASPADLAAVIRDALPTMIWLVPESVTVSDRRLVAVGSGPGRPVEGTEYVPSLPAQTDPEGTRGGAHRGGRLVIGADAVAIEGADGSATTISFDDLVTVEAHPDGSRALWADDGAIIRIQPTDWEDGASIGPRIDSRVQPWVVLHRRDPKPSTDATTTT